MNKIFRFICFCMMFIILTACTIKPSSEANIIALQGLIWQGDTIVDTVPTVGEYSLLGRITVSNGATWQLFQDEATTIFLENKTMNIVENENYAYIVVTAEDGLAKKTYPVIITCNTSIGVKVSFQTYQADYPTTQMISLPDYINIKNELLSYIPYPELEGHNFLGWYLDSELSLPFDKTQTITNDLTLYAKWEIITYTLEFVTNNDIELDLIEANYGTMIDLPQDLTKIGHTFGGWFLDSSFTKPVTSPLRLERNTIIYAKWDVNLYNINFVTNNDSQEILTNKMPYDSTLESWPNVSYTGHELVGWFYDANFQNPVTLPIRIESPITFYAKWQILSFTLNFVTNNETTIEPISAEFGTKITLPSNLTKAGHTFAGWYLEPDFKSKASDPFELVTNMTLYANWRKIQYSVNLVRNDGTGTIDTVQVDAGTSYNEPSIVYEGYNLVGWYYDEECSQPVTFPVTITGPIAFYAKWEIKTFTINFVTNHETQFEPITNKYGSTINQPQSLTKTGYTFGGWYQDASFSTPVSFPFTLKANLTLYAKWNINHYKVFFVSNIPNQDIIELDYEYLATVDALSLEYDEHVLVGWYLNPDFSGDSVDFPYEVSGEITFYAKWEVVKYLVEFVTNTEETIPSKNLPSGSFVEEPQSLTKDGYYFGGWYDHESMSNNPVTFPYQITGNTTFYARWLNEKEESVGLIYELSPTEDSYQVVGYVGNDYEVIIPMMYNGFPVKEVKNTTFQGNEFIYRVDFPSTIESIEKQSFLNCKSLKSVILPLRLTKLEEEIFKGCDALEFILVNEGVKFIESNVFLGSYSINMIRFLGDVDNSSDIHPLAFNGVYYPNLMVQTPENSKIADFLENSPYPQYQQIQVNRDVDEITDPKTIYPQLSNVKPFYQIYPTLNVNVTPTLRSTDYNDFVSEKFPRTLPVEYSEELYYAIVHRYKPTFNSSTSTAYLIYEEAKAILRSIIYQEMTEEEKIIAIHDWIGYNVNYDHALLALVESNPNSVLNFNRSFYLDGVFLDKLAVCDGYAKAFQLLCAMEGIVAERVVGDGVTESGSVGHAWNKVKIGDEWLLVDPTWGDASVSFSDSKKYEFIHHGYFFVTDSMVSNSHHEDTPIVLDTDLNQSTIHFYYKNNTFYYESSDFSGDYYVESEEELKYLLRAEVNDFNTNGFLEIYLTNEVTEEMAISILLNPDNLFGYQPLSYFYTSAQVLMLFRQ